MLTELKPTWRVNLWIVALLLFALFFISYPMIAGAAEYQVEIQYTYLSPDQDLDAAGMRMYAEGTAVCTTPTPTPGTTIGCDASALRPGPYNWTMTAVYVNGEESPHSAPYAFTLPVPDGVAPNIILMRIADEPEPVPPVD